jgi:hypothetical protein
MKKIVCSCGSGSFQRVSALFDTLDPKSTVIIEKIFAYKCINCGLEWQDHIIEICAGAVHNRGKEQIKLFDPYDEKYLKKQRKE